MNSLLRNLFARVRRFSSARPKDIPDIRQRASTELDGEFRLLAENSVDVICHLDSEMVARYVSPASLPVLGWRPEELVGGRVNMLVHPDDMPLLNEAAARRRQSGAVTSTIFRMFRKDRTMVWIEANTRMLSDPSRADPGGLVLALRDITDRKTLEDELERLALTDGLTAVANRRAFDLALKEEWHRTMRAGSQMSLLLLDIDLFKAFNDCYGHQSGDACLRAVAAAIKNALHRAGDSVARYGGEEFAVILPATDGQGAREVAEQIRQAVQGLGLSHAENPAGDFCVTISIGVATAFSRAGGTVTMPEGLLIAADGALYRAKQNGRNSVAAAMLVTPDESLSAGDSDGTDLA
ncbi:MAG: sensor domain-containing diguanylate cyclase [Janthinobacterium lividum]